MEMANLPSKYTGRSPTVMVSTKFAHDGKVSKHAPRVKVSNVHGRFAHDDNFVVTVEHEPRVIGKCKLSGEHLDSVRDWVKLNHEHLVKVWHHGSDMDPHDVVDGVKKI